MKTKGSRIRTFGTIIILIAALSLLNNACEPVCAQGSSSIYLQASPITEIGVQGLVINPVSEKNEGIISAAELEKRNFGKTLRNLFSFLKQGPASRKSQKNGPYDAIIVPGIPYHEGEDAGIIMKNRVLWACYLYSEGIAKNIIFSGGAVYTPYTESYIMTLYAIELGVPAEHIFCEVKAEHSTENIVYSLRLANEMGFEKVAIATGPFQSSFLTSYVKDHSLPLSFISLRIMSIRDMKKNPFPEIDPDLAYQNEFTSLKERESRSERLQGTLGNKISD